MAVIQSFIIYHLSFTIAPEWGSGFNYGLYPNPNMQLFEAGVLDPIIVKLTVPEFRSSMFNDKTLTVQISY